MVTAGINHADERSRAGEFKLLFQPSLPGVAGGELSGEIVALGQGVRGFDVGDAVIAYTGVVEMGAYVQFAVVEQAALAHARALGVRYRFLFIEPDGEALATLAALVDEGVPAPVVNRVLPFGQTLDPLQQALGGGTRGKQVVTTQPDPVTTGVLAEQPAQEGLDDGRPATWAQTPTSRGAMNGEHLLYHHLGPLGGTPVILLTHLGATLDEWDPIIVDALAVGRRAVAIELTGVGGSTGVVPGTIQEMVDTAHAMIAALGFEQVDLCCFSISGFIAQQVTLDDPDLVRRLVLTGAGPAGGHGSDRPTGGAYVYWDMLRGAVHRTDTKELPSPPHCCRQGRCQAVPVASAHPPHGPGPPDPTVQRQPPDPHCPTLGSTGAAGPVPDHRPHAHRER